MSAEGTGLTEALDIAIEAEMKARDFYKDAQGKVQDPRGKDLLGQLANFEQNHFDKLTELKSSLAGDGGFIEYGGTEFGSTAGISEAQGSIEGEKDTVIDILILAINAESKAHERYLGLAGMTEDPNGKEMFNKLAQEELLHRRILSDEFYHISNKGVWVWSE